MLGKWSLRHCRIKRGKETRSFLIRSPFDIYPSQTSKNQVFTIREMILCGYCGEILGESVGENIVDEIYKLLCGKK